MVITKGVDTMAHIFAFITCSRAKWEATVEEYAEMTGQTEAEVREQWEDDSDFDPETDTIRLEDAIEEHGWIDRSWSTVTLHESRNDVRPVVDCDENDEDLEDEVRDALQWLEGGYEDNGDGTGTFYASQPYEPYTEAWRYDYAVHFVRKTSPSENGSNNVLDWRETPWHPFKDGGITLP